MSQKECQTTQETIRMPSEIDSHVAIKNSSQNTSSAQTNNSLNDVKKLTRGIKTLVLQERRKQCHGTQQIPSNVGEKQTFDRNSTRSYSTYNDKKSLINAIETVRKHIISEGGHLSRRQRRKIARSTHVDPRWVKTVLEFLQSKELHTAIKLCMRNGIPQIETDPSDSTDTILVESPSDTSTYNTVNSYQQSTRSAKSFPQKAIPNHWPDYLSRKSRLSVGRKKYLKFQVPNTELLTGLSRNTRTKETQTLAKMGDICSYSLVEARESPMLHVEPIRQSVIYQNSTQKYPIIATASHPSFCREDPVFQLRQPEVDYEEIEVPFISKRYLRAPVFRPFSQIGYLTQCDASTQTSKRNISKYHDGYGPLSTAPTPYITGNSSYGMNFPMSKQSCGCHLEYIRDPPLSTLRDTYPSVSKFKYQQHPANVTESHEACKPYSKHENTNSKPQLENVRHSVENSVTASDHLSHRHKTSKQNAKTEYSNLTQENYNTVKHSRAYQFPVKLSETIPLQKLEYSTYSENINENSNEQYGHQHLPQFDGPKLTSKALFSTEDRTITPTKYHSRGSPVKSETLQNVVEDEHTSLRIRKSPLYTRPNSVEYKTQNNSPTPEYPQYLDEMSIHIDDHTNTGAINYESTINDDHSPSQSQVNEIQVCNHQLSHEEPNTPRNVECTSVSTDTHDTSKPTSNRMNKWHPRHSLISQMSRSAKKQKRIRKRSTSRSSQGGSAYSQPVACTSVTLRLRSSSTSRHVSRTNDTTNVLRGYQPAVPRGFHIPRSRQFYQKHRRELGGKSTKKAKEKTPHHQERTEGSKTRTREKSKVKLGKANDKAPEGLPFTSQVDAEVGTSDTTFEPSREEKMCSPPRIIFSQKYASLKSLPDTPLEDVHNSQENLFEDQPTTDHDSKDHSDKNHREMRIASSGILHENSLPSRDKSSLQTGHSHSNQYAQIAMNMLMQQKVFFENHLKNLTEMCNILVSENSTPNSTGTSGLDAKQRHRRRKRRKNSQIAQCASQLLERSQKVLEDEHHSSSECEKSRSIDFLSKSSSALDSENKNCCRESFEVKMTDPHCHRHDYKHQKRHRKYFSSETAQGIEEFEDHLFHESGFHLPPG